MVEMSLGISLSHAPTGKPYESTWRIRCSSTLRPLLSSISWDTISFADSVLPAPDSPLYAHNKKQQERLGKGSRHQHAVKY